MGPLGATVFLFICIAFPVASTIPREIPRGTQRKDCSLFDPNPSTPHDHEEMLSMCTQSLQNLEGYLQAIGFHSTKAATPIADENPCGSTSGPGNPNETDWNVLDGSVCVKLLRGLHSFENATELCNNEIHKGLDIATPSIILSDLFIRYNNHHNIFREQTHMASVWVQRNEYFSTGSIGLNCTELIVNRLGNSTTEGFELRDVECERLNSVVCVKPIPVSYVQLINRQLQTKEETENLRAELEAQRIQMEKKSLEKDSTLTLEVAQVEEKLREKVKLLIDQLQEMQTSQEADKTQKTKQLEDVERIGRTTTDFLAQVDSSVKSLKIWEEKANTEIQRNLKKAESENQKLREELNSILDSFRLELVSQMKSKSAVFKTELKEVRREKEELQERVIFLEGKFKALESETSLQISNLKESCKSFHLSTELQVSGVQRQLEEMVVTRETTLFNLTQIKSWNEETEIQLGSFGTDLRVLGDQVEQLRSSNEKSIKVLQETTMKRNDWYLDGPTTFVIQKAMGTWYLVEGFYRTSKYSPDRDCEEYGFSLEKNYGIKNKERWRVLSQNKNGTITRNLQTDNQSPYFWTQTDAYTKMWLKTDYVNWGILALCNNKDVTSCSFIFTLSRTRKFPPVTLHNLREAVEQAGFLKQYGSLINTNSC